MADTDISRQIDAIIAHANDWQGKMLSDLRRIITTADPAIIEEVKWKKPSKPSGIPVWSYKGNVCMADVLKNAVRLTFPKGAEIPDPNGLFNTRLDSKTVRAIDFSMDSVIDETGLRKIIVEAVKLN